MFYFTDILKTEKKFDNKKFKSYKRIWDCNHQGIQDIVQIYYDLDPVLKSILKRHGLCLIKKIISNTNNVLRKICNTENWLSMVDEEDDINYLNEKHVADDKIYVIFLLHHQRYALRPTRTLFSDNNNLEHFSNVEEDENEIDLAINNIMFLKVITIVCSDGSIKCNQQFKIVSSEKI